MSQPITIRPPSTISSSAAKDFNPPETSWLEGTWHVTHSTLPMWKSKRNVRITYKAITSTNQIDDLVEYQTLKSDKLKTVHGIDTPSPGASAAFDWRGKGLLKIASSHWKLLGYGTSETVDWAVTYFSKTLFTPAGIDVYTRDRAAMSLDLLQSIREAMAKVEDPTFKELKDQIFEIKHDS